MKQSPLQPFVYPQHYQEHAKQFRKRMAVQQFKKMDLKRMKEEFSVPKVLGQVLREGDYSQQQGVFEQGPKGTDRYSDVKVYRHNRIKIDGVQNFYINASSMKSVLDNSPYAIFAQAPVNKVIEHFWYACYHYQIPKIIMLCAFQDPRRGTQAEKYWPQLNQEVNFESVKIRVKTEAEDTSDPDHVRTKIVMKGPEGERIIEHVHWTAWGDMSKPMGQKSQKFFQSLVGQCIDLIDAGKLPLIHCSAGIGRTGTLGASIQALRCARHNKQLSIFEIVENMRSHRMGCVQTFQQYCFVYNQVQKML